MLKNHILPERSVVRWIPLRLLLTTLHPPPHSNARGIIPPPAKAKAALAFRTFDNQRKHSISAS
jgi:hypothetical protein